MKRTVPVAAILAATLVAQPQPTLAQTGVGEVIAAGSMIAGGAKAGFALYDGIKFLVGFDWWDKTWWVCEYADGTKIYNHFRSKRDGANVFRYFTGNGDCDSVIGNPDCGGILPICYETPLDAQRLADMHGGIKDIRRENPPPCPPPSEEELKERRHDHWRDP